MELLKISEKNPLIENIFRIQNHQKNHLINCVLDDNMISFARLSFHTITTMLIKIIILS